MLVSIKLSAVLLLYIDDEIENKSSKLVDACHIITQRQMDVAAKRTK